MLALISVKEGLQNRAWAADLEKVPFHQLSWSFTPAFTPATVKNTQFLFLCCTEGYCQVIKVAGCEIWLCFAIAWYEGIGRSSSLVMQWAYHGSWLVFPFSGTTRNALMLKHFWRLHTLYSENVSKLGNTYANKGLEADFWGKTSLEKHFNYVLRSH